MTYKIFPPLGSMVLSKEIMTEAELRDFAYQVVNQGRDNASEELGQVSDADYESVWAEKVKKDPIADVVEWLKPLGYQITEV